MPPTRSRLRPIVAGLARTALAALLLGPFGPGPQALFGAGLGAAPARAGEEILIDGIAAQVGTEIVLLSEVHELARPIEERMREAGAPASEIRNMQADALERLIESKLIEGVVRRLELEATDGEIDAAIAGIAQDNGITVAQLQRSIEDHGLTIDEYRYKIKGEIERSKVLNAMVRTRVRVEPEEIELAFEERYGEQRGSGEEVHLRHILVSAGGASTRNLTTACIIAEDAARKIRTGDINFSDMARRVTDMNPEKAGDLGWMHKDDMAAWMQSAVAGLGPGQISDVIETPFGCNLLQLVERRAFTPVQLADVEEQLSAELSGQKMQKEYIDWLDALRKQTYVSRKGLYSESERIDRITGGEVGR